MCKPVHERRTRWRKKTHDAEEINPIESDDDEEEDDDDGCSGARADGINGTKKVYFLSRPRKQTKLLL